MLANFEWSLVRGGGRSYCCSEVGGLGLELDEYWCDRHWFSRLCRWSRPIHGTAFRATQNPPAILSSSMYTPKRRDMCVRVEVDAPAISHFSAADRLQVGAAMPFPQPPKLDDRAGTRAHRLCGFSIRKPCWGLLTKQLHPSLWSVERRSASACSSEWPSDKK